jgi:hypothetical protein
MLRFRKSLAGVVLSLALTFGTITPPSLLTLGAVTGTAAIVVTQTACGPDSLEKLNTSLNQIAHALETAIDTNGRLYEANAYGQKGSAPAIAMRQRIATVIHDSNEYLIQALGIAKGLTKATFEGNKLLILEKLALAGSGLRVGHATIDLVLQSIATLISQAVAIAQLFKASDVQYIRRAVPALNRHLEALAHIREINTTGMEVFAE